MMFFLGKPPPANRIYIVTLRPTQLAQTLFLQKKAYVAKCFFDICNTEMAQWHKKSRNLDIQGQFFTSKKF